MMDFIKNYKKWPYHLVPLILLLFLSNFIIRYKSFYIEKGEFNQLNAANLLNYFFYYRAVFVVFCSLVCIIFYKIFIKEKLLPLHRYYVPAGILFIFFILSAVFSEFPEISFKGHPARNEGLFVLLAYIIIWFCSINLVRSIEDVKLVLKVFILSSGILVFFGYLQLLGILPYDVMTNFFLKYFQGLHHSMQSYPNQIKVLANSNYLGSLMAMILPFSIMLFLSSKGYLRNILTFIFAILVYINWFGCSSRAGLFGGIIALLFVLFFIRNKLKLHRIKLLLLAGGFIFTLLVLNSRFDDRFIGRVKSIKGASTKPPQNSNFLWLQDFKVTPNSVFIKTDSSELNIVHKNGHLTFFDQNDDAVTINIQGENFSFNHKEFKKIRGNLAKGKLTLTINQYNIYVKIITKKGLVLVDPKTQEKELEVPEHVGFLFRRGAWGAIRFYLWSVFIPQLKKTVFLGNGPNTTSASRPFDIITEINRRIKYFTFNYAVQVGPHNEYIKMGLNTGVLSLIVYLTLLSIYWIETIKLYFRKKIFKTLDYLSIGCFCATIGYSISALFNDTNILFGPTFWFLFGTSIFINYHVKYSDKEKDAQSID